MAKRGLVSESKLMVHYFERCYSVHQMSRVASKAHHVYNDINKHSMQLDFVKHRHTTALQ